MLSWLVFIWSLLVCGFFGLRFADSKKREESVHQLMIFMMLFPTTSFMVPYFTKFQLVYYYPFFVFLWLYYVVHSYQKKKTNRAFLSYTCGASIFFTAYLIYNQLQGRSYAFIDILKDAKPFILIGLAYAFYLLAGQYFKNYFHLGHWKKVLKWHFWVSTIIFLLMKVGKLHLWLSTDPYYLNKPIRYLDLGTYTICAFLIFKITRKEKLKFVEMLYCFLPLIYSGNRTLFIAMAVFYGVYSVMNASLKTNVYRFLVFGSALLAFVYVVRKAESSSPLYRFQSLMSVDEVSRILTNRYSPFTDTLNDFEAPSDYVFGLGPGRTYYIPWFEYRTNIKNHNIYLDNFYLSMYGKYGVFSLLFLWFLFVYFKEVSNRKFLIYYAVFLCTIGLTNCFSHQFTFLWLLIMPIMANAEASLPNKESQKSIAG